MAEVDWSGDLSIRLVEEYRQRPELWDSSNQLYRVQAAKYDAWADMAKIFDCDITDLRKKLNSIFASHRREKSKIRNGGRSTWFLYPYLRFLPNHLDASTAADGTVELIVGTNDDSYSHTQTTDGHSDEHSDEHSDGHSDGNSDETSENEDDDNQESEVMIKQEPVMESYSTEQPANSPEPKSKPERRKLRSPVKKYKLTKPTLKRKLAAKDNDTLDSKLLETLKLLRNSDLSRKKDECDSFGDYIAVSLRKHDERTQSMIKQAINNILFEQEMKKYSSNQYTVLLSGVDENPLVIGDGDDK